MNQILYKGQIFGGVGEDVTNKSYGSVTIHNPITDQDEIYTPIGGENAEIFNSYKNQDRNIASGEYSSISGKGNKELTTEDGESGFNNVSGQDNILIDGHFNEVNGKDNFLNSEYNQIFGKNNNIINDIPKYDNNVNGYALFTSANDGHSQAFFDDINKLDFSVEGKISYFEHSEIEPKEGDTAIIYFIDSGSSEYSQTDPVTNLRIETWSLTNDDHPIAYYHGNKWIINTDEITGSSAIGIGNKIKNSYQSTAIGTSNIINNNDNAIITGQNNNVEGIDYEVVEYQKNDCKGWFYCYNEYEHPNRYNPLSYTIYSTNRENQEIMFSDPDDDPIEYGDWVYCFQVDKSSQTSTTATYTKFNYIVNPDQSDRYYPLICYIYCWTPQGWQKVESTDVNDDIYYFKVELKQSDNNFINGNFNKISKTSNNTIFGERNEINNLQNSIYSGNNFIKGRSNKIESNNSSNSLPSYTFISGYENEFIGSGGANSIFGSSNKITTGSTYGVFIAGQGNKILGPGYDYCSAIFGSANVSKTNTAGGLIIGGNGNHVENSYQGIVCGMENQVYGAQSPAVFGQGNIIGDSEHPNYTGIASGGMVSGKGNRVSQIDSGVHVLGTRNNVGLNGWCDNGTLVCGDGNTVDTSHYSLISGAGNRSAGYSYGILGGNSCRVGGSYALTCGIALISNSIYGSIFTGYNNKTQYINYSLVSGATNQVNSIYSSVISGYDLESEDINSSIIVGDKIKIGRRSKKWGVINDLSSYSPSILTKFNTETQDFTNTTSGYIHYLDYSWTTNKQGISVIWINKDQYFRKNGTIWEEITKAQRVYYPYLGTTISYIENGSTEMSLSMVTSAEYNTSMYSYQIDKYDRIQVMNSLNYDFDKTYIYLNNEWVEATNSNTPEPYSAYYSTIQGKNIELTSPIRSSAIFGEGHILNKKTDYSLITGYNNQTYGSSNIIGRNNTVIQGSDNCYILGNNNDALGGSFSSKVLGDNNNLTNGAAFCRVLGDYNYLDGSASNNTVIGNNNIIAESANNEIILGDSNYIINSFSKSLLLGFNNRVGQGNTPKYTFIVGTNNEISKGSGVANIIGIGNTQSYNGTFCSLMGYGLTNGYQSKGRFITGRFNECNLAQAANLIMIGNGYTDSGSIVRQNALTIDENGKIITNINNAGYNTFNLTVDRLEFTDNYIGISLDSPFTTANTITILVGTAEQIAAGEYTTQVWTKDSTFSSVNHTFTDYSSVYFTSEEKLSNIYSLPTIGNYYWNPNNWAMHGMHWTKIDAYSEISLGRTTAPTIEAHNVIDYNNNEYYIKGVSESNPYIRTKTAIETVSSVTNGIQTIKFENATITSGYGIGQVDITPNKIIVTSYNNNSDDEKETVEFTFEDLQSLKNIAPAQNINNTPFPQI